MCTQLLCLISIDRDIKPLCRGVTCPVLSDGEVEVKPEAGAWRPSTAFMRPNFLHRFSVDLATESFSRLVSASETTTVGEGPIEGRVWKCNRGGGKQDIRWKGGSGFSEHLPRAHTFVMFPVRRKPTEPLAVWGQLACLRLVTSQLYWCIGGGTEHLSGVN